MPDVVATLTEDLVSRGVDRESAEQRLEALDPDGDFTAYHFRCSHCGKHLAYADLT